MSVYSHAEVEAEVFSFWKKDGTYEKLRKARAGGKRFFFMDGPPYATGSIHLGTAWNKIIKDAYLRYHRMLGENAWDQPGYDTHGTPIETKVEKELGYRSKKDIERNGIGNFTKHCREFATKYIGVMNEQFANLGVWMDWERPYLTLSNEYIEGAWYTFKKSFAGGHLYKGKYPVHVCPRCETVVAYNEVEYTKQTDNSVYVKFRLNGQKNKYLVIWTTTPWTLPGNTGVMVHPKFTYAEAEMGNGEVWIVAVERLQHLADAIEAGYRVLREVPGTALEGLTYEAPLAAHMRMPQLTDAHRVILSDRYVNVEDGTGLVHTAPGHGKEDFEEGTKAGLPAVCPVDIDGTLSEETGKYAGKKARVVDAQIIEDLARDGMLVYKHPYTHDYPVCWRCQSPLLQVGVPQWFFRVTAIREKLLSENAKVKWFPKWAGDRFRDWLENLSDWPISRQRYWGIPLPIWECPCGEIEVIGSFAELKERSGLKHEIDFHRPAIDEVKLKCRKCGKEVRRVEDVLDVWFDSGVATWASLDYPRKKEPFSSMWPSAFQTEGPDQFRGWWNSQMITSVLTFGKAPFSSVMMHGFVMDVKGIKLSKSKGNFIDPADILEKHGRDAFRFYLLSSPLWNDFYFNWDEMKDVSRMFTVFWNTYSFIKMYASGTSSLVSSAEETGGKRPGAGGGSHHHASPAAMPKVLQPEDRWIISRVNGLMEKGKDVEEREMHKLTQGISCFILEDLSRTYIKMIRDRVNPWYEGENKKAAEWTLNYALQNLLKVMAPVSPFITDMMYRDLYGKDSVHMQHWPKADAKLIDKDLEEGMAAALALVEAAAAARHEASVKLRWPLSEITVAASDEKTEKHLKALSSVIAGMANAKEVKFVKKKPAKAKDFAKGSFALGKVLEDEALLREVCRAVQIKRKEAGLMVHDKIHLFVDAEKKSLEPLRKQVDELLAGVGAGSVIFGPFEGEEKGRIDFEGARIRFAFGKA